jgi:hypothetical protein
MDADGGQAAGGLGGEQMQPELSGEPIEVHAGDGQVGSERADQAEAVASLREFVAVAVHDLRGAQGALLAATDLIASASDDASRASLSACIERESAHLGRLIDDLYLLSVADTGRLEVHPDTVELVPILQQAAAESGKHEVGVHAAEGLRVHADPCHVRRIVANLVHNAFAHGAPPVRIIAADLEGQVEIRVTDSGPGVPQPFVPRLFARFSRAGGTTGGAGLGLAIVAELARLNGGSTQYQPHPTGRPGATFVVRLPQEPGDAVHGSRPAAPMTGSSAPQIPRLSAATAPRQPWCSEGRRSRPGRHVGGTDWASLLQAIEQNRDVADHVRCTLEETVRQTLVATTRSKELRVLVRDSMRTRRRLLREGSALADE